MQEKLAILYTVRYTSIMDKRQELLNTALQLFSAEGYSSVGIQKIVTACGVTKPTLYHYFGSKSGLLQALFKERLQPFLTSLHDLARYDGDLSAALDRILNAYFRFSRTEPAMFRLMISLSLGPKENEAVRIATEYITEQYSLLRKLFRDAIPDHGNLRGKEEMLSMLFYGTLSTSSAFFLHTGNTINEETIRNIRKQFMHGIFC